MNYPLLFLKLPRRMKVVKIKVKKRRPLKIFFIEGWSIEGHVTKVVEWIVMNDGLLILHKTKVSIL